MLTVETAPLDVPRSLFLAVGLKYGLLHTQKKPSELPAEDKPTHMLQHASSLHSK